MRNFASFAVAVVLPDPCRPAMRITVGGRGANATPALEPPMSAVSSSLTILTTCWPGFSWFSTSEPRQRSLTVEVNDLTTLKLTSASSSARRISRIVALTSASVSVPRERTSASVAWSFSESVSNTASQSRWRDAAPHAVRARTKQPRRAPHAGPRPA